MYRRVLYDVEERVLCAKREGKKAKQGYTEVLPFVPFLFRAVSNKKMKRKNKDTQNKDQDKEQPTPSPLYLGMLFFSYHQILPQTDTFCAAFFPNAPPAPTILHNGTGGIKFSLWQHDKKRARQVLVSETPKMLYSGEPVGQKIARFVCAAKMSSHLPKATMWQCITNQQAR
jgi:hypothetical protein